MPIKTVAVKTTLEEAAIMITITIPAISTTRMMIKIIISTILITIMTVLTTLTTVPMTIKPLEIINTPQMQIPTQIIEIEMTITQI